jgi:hypothetical protein
MIFEMNHPGLPVIFQKDITAASLMLNRQKPCSIGMKPRVDPLPL